VAVLKTSACAEALVRAGCDVAVLDTSGLTGLQVSAGRRWRSALPLAVGRHPGMHTVILLLLLSFLQK
jgi:hypothetical protein